MATVGSTVAAALWLLRVVDPDESPEPYHYERCIGRLNAAMARIEGNRAYLGWVAVSHPEDILPLEPEHEDLAVHVLYMAARPIYGVPVDPDVSARYRQLMTDLYRDMANNSPIQSNHSLPYPDSYNDYYGVDIRTGSGWV